MTDEQIRENFSKLGLNTEHLKYTNPYEFAKGFKRCSVLQSVQTTYSANSQPQNINTQQNVNNGRA